MKTIITRIKRLALALCFVTPLVSWAVEPAAVWDGDFTAKQTGYALNLNGNELSDNNSVINITNTYSGVDINFSAEMSSSGVTLLVKYSDFVCGGKAKVIATQCNGGQNYSNDRTGVDLQIDNKLWGMWYNNGWADNGTKSSAGVFPESGVYAFTYKNNGGTYLYASEDPSETALTQVFGESGLKAGSDKLWGVTVGGMRSGTVNTNWRAAQGAKITGIAVFAGVLSVSEMTSYLWPSEIKTVTVDADTTVSAINALIAGADESIKLVVVDVADGVTIDVDTAFVASKPTTIASEGNVTLSAATQPDASYFSAVDFSAVKGAVKRSWLANPGVVGFNFRNNSGGDTSGALATGTWYNDGGNVANGTSTAMFADGLSTLTWASQNTWEAGSGSILSGYLDDGSKNGNGAEVLLSNVPYEEYDVIIYCNSDSNPGNFLAKTVNGTTYTWDSDAGAVVEGSGTWGTAALAIPVYGVNALRIKNLTGPLTIYGTPRSGISRGGIAAIQIMPPDTPDNIRTYTLTLDGTATTWSEGTWTLEGNTVDAPTSGYVEIVASASTELTVDEAVSLADLKIRGSEDVVVTISNGENASLYSIKATVNSGVLKVGSNNLFGSTPAINIEDGATIDVNGNSAGSGTLFVAGDGAGNWPWAITSSSSGIIGTFTLAGDATIGGSSDIVVGANWAGGYIYLNGYTLTKTGTYKMTCHNVNTIGGGTLDLQGGTTVFDQWTSLDGSESVQDGRCTTVTVRNGATLQNSAGRRLWVDTLNVLGGSVTTTATGWFAVNTAFTGACETAKLELSNGATATLTGNLTVADLVSGASSVALDTGTAAATVTVSGTVNATGTISVGSGVTPVFSGESDVTATLSYAVDPSPTESTALAFTQQDNWKGTVVLDYAITGADNGSVFQPGKYGNANSTVCLGQGATNIFLSVRGSSNFGDIDTKLYFKGDVSLRNGWGKEAKATTIPQLGADEGVTFTTRQGANTSNGTTYYTITSLKDFAGTIALSDLTAVTIGNVEMDALPEKGALVVKATTGTGNNKGTISGSVTVGNETVQLVYDTVNDVSGLYRPNTVDITVPTVANTTITVTVGGEPVAPATQGESSNTYSVADGATVTVTYTSDGYEVTGGSFEFTASEGYSVDTTGVKTTQYVASITYEATTTKYTSLQAAVDAAASGRNIVLLASEEAGATVSREVTFTVTPGDYTYGTIVVDGDYILTTTVLEGKTRYSVAPALFAVTINEVRTLYPPIAFMTGIEAANEGPIGTTVEILSGVPQDYVDRLPMFDLNTETGVFTKVADPVAAVYEGVIQQQVYRTLAAAIEAAEDGLTVKLLADLDLTSTVTIAKDVTLDLNGHNVASLNCRAFHVSAGAFVLTGSGTVSATADENVNTSTFPTSSSVIRVGSNDATTSFTLGENVTVTSDYCYGITYFGKQAQTVVIDGTVDVTSVQAAISGNGTSTLAATTLTVNGTVSATQDYAIYNPQAGTTAINGTVTGRGGVEVKGGTVTVGATAKITATGTPSYTQSNQDGTSTVGYAIASVGNSSYKQPAVVNVENGATVNGTVIIIKENKSETYGTVNSAVNTLAIPEGFVWSAVESGYTLAVVQEVPVEAGAQTDPVDTEAAAQADAAKVVPSVPAAVAAKLSDEQETAYKALFEAKVVEVKVGETTKYAVEVALKDTVVTEIQAAVDDEAEDLATAAVAAAADATNGGKATVATTPGLYYVVEAGTEPNGTVPASCTLAESNSTKLTIPNKGAKGFYKIRVSVTPVDVP